MAMLKSLVKGKDVALQLANCKIFNKRIPIRLSLQATKKCNLKCEYCYTANDPSWQERTTEQLCDLFDEMYSRGTRWVNILGGEPLMRKDIGDIVKYAKKKHMYVELATNGWFIKNNIDVLKKVDHLFVSIDGDRKTCDITRGKGTYDKVIEGITLLNENNIRFRLHAVLTKYSRDSFEHMLMLSKKYNAPVNFSEPGMVPGKKHLLLSEPEVVEFYKKVQEYKKKGYQISSPWIALKYLISFPKKDDDLVYETDPPEIKKQVYPCYMKHRNCFVDVEGGFYACGRMWGKGLNIYKDGFDKCWEYLKNLPCYACRNMGAIEQSLVLNMNSKAILNALGSYVQ